MNERPGILKCLNATCRDAARLITERDERRLSWPERAGLYIHLVICRSCRRYRRGVVFLRRLMRTAGRSGALSAQEGLPGAARQRIHEKLLGP